MEQAAIILLSILGTTLRNATPLTLGGLSGVFSERAGVVNIAIEGMMLAAAFFGFFTASMTGSLFLGLLAALAAGGILGLLHALFSVTFKVDQIISGTVINILALGITGFLNRQYLKAGTVTSAGILPKLTVPRVGELGPITLGAIALVFVSHYVLFHTAWGLRLRSVGEHPRAADTVGIDVYRMRYTAVVISGLLAGLAGAYLTLESLPTFEDAMTNGRGFIALAAMIFGKWTPLGTWGATLLFGAAEATQVMLQILGIQIPYQFVGMLPYLLTMIVLAGVVGRAEPPAADGVPYEKEGIA